MKKGFVPFKRKVGIGNRPHERGRRVKIAVAPGYGPRAAENSMEGMSVDAGMVPPIAGGLPPGPGTDLRKLLGLQHGEEEVAAPAGREVQVQLERERLGKLLAGTGAESAQARQLYDKYGVMLPEEQLYPDFLREEANMEPQMAAKGVKAVQGNTDSVPAMLTPREAVLNRNAAELAGRGKIARLNEAGNKLAVEGVDLASGGGKSMKKISYGKAKGYQGGVGAVRGKPGRGAVPGGYRLPTATEMATFGMPRGLPGEAGASAAVPAAVNDPTFRPGNLQVLGPGGAYDPAKGYKGGQPGPGWRLGGAGWHAPGAEKIGGVWHNPSAIGAWGPGGRQPGVGGILGGGGRIGSIAPPGFGRPYPGAIAYGGGGGLPNNFGYGGGNARFLGPPQQFGAPSGMGTQIGFAPGTRDPNTYGGGGRVPMPWTGGPQWGSGSINLAGGGPGYLGPPVSSDANQPLLGGGGTSGYLGGPGYMGGSGGGTGGYLTGPWQGRSDVNPPRQFGGGGTSGYLGGPGYMGGGSGSFYPPKVQPAQQRPMGFQGGVADLGGPSIASGFGPPPQLQGGDIANLIAALKAEGQKQGLSGSQIQGLLSLVQGMGGSGGGAGGAADMATAATGAGYQGGISDIGYPPMVGPGMDYHADKGSSWVGPYDPNYIINRQP